MLWSSDECKCGAQQMDECCCCPTCYTPQGDDSIPTNGCEDDNGCGLNRYHYNLAKALAGEAERQE